MVSINRVTKVVKGGRILGFAALTVVGDGDGGIGMGKGKSREVPVAVQKAMEEARRKMVARQSSRTAAFHHPSSGHHGASTCIDAAGSPGYRHHCGRSDAGGIRSDGRDGRRCQVALDLPIRTTWCVRPSTACRA
jgi:ribosomal protein S5